MSHPERDHHQHDDHREGPEPPRLDEHEQHEHDHHGPRDMAGLPEHPTGTSPMPPAIASHAGHEEHAHHADHTGHERMFRTRFWGSLALSIPVLIFSAAVQHLLGFTLPAFPGSDWIPFIFALIIFAYGGVPFMRMALPEIRNREPGMMTLITLAISVALVYSLAAQVLGLGEGFFWELVTLIDIMLLGHWLEMRSVRQASGALNELAKLMPDTAELVRPDGSTSSISTKALKTGDVVLVRPGASIPADGAVVEGESERERVDGHGRIEARG